MQPQRPLPALQDADAAQLNAWANDQPPEMDIKALFTVLRRRWKVIVGVMGIAVAAVILGTWTQKPVYEATAKLLMDTSQSAGSGSQQTQDMPVLSDLLGNAQARNIQTQVVVLESRSIMHAAMRKLGFGPETAPLPKPRVDVVKDTDVISVAMDSTSPTEAADLANAIAGAYIERSQKNNQEYARTARVFVEHRLVKVGHDLNIAEDNLLHFKQATHTTSLPDEIQSRLASITDLEQKQSTAQSDLKAAQSQVQVLGGQLRRTDPTYQALVTNTQSPAVGELQTRLADLEIQRASLLQDYQPQAPEVQAVDEQIRQAKADLAEQIHGSFATRERQTAANPLYQDLEKGYADAVAEVVTGRARVAALDSLMQAQTNGLSNLPKRERMLAGLSRDADTLTKTYNDLAAERQTLLVTEAAKLPSASFLDPAIPNRSPIRPKKAMDLVLGILLGVILGLAAAFLLEHLDDTVKPDEDTEHILGLPILAVIPRFERSLGPAVAEYDSSNSLKTEGYRMLRSAIRFARPDAPLRLLMVTSAVPGEGKTTTVVNLATALANNGMKVVIVDLDLRRPSLARVFELGNSVGFTSVVVGETSLADALQPTDNPNLMVLTSGPVPPNPPEFLDSARSRETLQELGRQVDVLVIDTPPTMMMTDGLIVASMADAVVVVAEAGKTERRAVQRTIQLLRQATPHVLGLCLNKMDVDRRGSYYYGYYYNYNYYYDSQSGSGTGRNGRRNGARKKLSAASESRPDKEQKL